MIRAFLAERRGVAALELGLVGPFVLLTLLSIMEFGYLFATKLALENWVQTVARQIQTGSAQSNTTWATFNANVACGTTGKYQISLWLTCSNLLTYTVKVTDYYSQGAFTLPISNGQVTSPSSSFCVAQPGQLIELNMVYMAPTFLATLLPNTVSWNGSKAIPITAAAAFATESYANAGTGGNAC
jgi:Flp pilus assembly protein TadG